MRRMNSSELICSRLSSLEHAFTQITPHKRGSGIRSWAPFLCSAPPGHPPPSPHSLSFGGTGTVKTCTKKSRKTRFSQVISSPYALSNARRLIFILPMPSPWKSLTKSARAAENPGFFKQIAPIFEKLLSAAAKLDVCPRRGSNESGAGVAPGARVWSGFTSQYVHLSPNADIVARFNCNFSEILSKKFAKAHFNS